MSKRPTVKKELSDCIMHLHKLLHEEFGSNFQYHIVGLEKTIAAAHTAKCQKMPQKRIYPKTRKPGGGYVHKEDSPPQALPME